MIPYRALLWAMVSILITTFIGVLIERAFGLDYRFVSGYIAATVFSELRRGQ